ncbi:hypothetical protein AGABI1DRAFT_130692 [Agaricus bisporus var. burnettii JB137-S8]|uniref:C2H2-type domain-containing protein n=1 Tax=Agaricus bisporus var. burnettii (strain JB137-S8 / ATCC MYA-4627 / FGSC 10392) TaxID=597362 RepID=K5VR72_AGABU|nr:uncharacterized protein AGABI1DRAFT_130692 [Agaricus bisporus var. burnettii JB137-S8]EKM76964.1 hypothetical protein AGABI1DRAFT_130692 [Agaricus bisporus var. burnettii JB137-S8]
MPTESSPECGSSDRADSDNKSTIENRIAVLRRRFKCDHEGCSFTATQIHNLKVHMKIHTKKKDQRCVWPNSTGSPCKFRCSDPSSLNRHIKVHIVRAIAKGDLIPAAYQKFVTRMKGVCEYTGVTENDASSNLPYTTPPAATPNFNLNFLSSPLVTGNPYPVTKSPEPTFPFPETAPTAVPPCAFERSPSIQLFPVPVDARLNNFPFGFASNLQASDEDRLRFHPPPLSKEPTVDEYRILLKRMKQLVPILAKAKRPLSKEEMKGVLCWIVETRDGFSPKRF